MYKVLIYIKVLQISALPLGYDTLLCTAVGSEVTTQQSKTWAYICLMHKFPIILSQGILRRCIRATRKASSRMEAYPCREGIYPLNRRYGCHTRYTATLPVRVLGSHGRLPAGLSFAGC